MKKSIGYFNFFDQSSLVAIDWNETLGMMIFLSYITLVSFADDFIYLSESLCYIIYLFIILLQFDVS